MVRQQKLILGGAMSLAPFATGLLRCFDELGHVIACLHSGQDGEYRKGRSLAEGRFEIEGELVFDRLSGLHWCRDANPLQFPLDWAEAFDAIERLNNERYLGLDDWRLPNRRELCSLIDYGARNPALPHHHPFHNLFLGWYWSSTTAAIAEGHAWYVHLEGGRMFYGGKDQAYMVWPVRGGDGMTLYQTGQRKSFHRGDDGDLQLGIATPHQRFETQGDVVLDRLTGLHWSSHANLAGKAVPWSEALARVTTLQQTTSLPWRLPNITELESLVDCSCHTPALPRAAPFELVMDGYWSSTSSGFEPDWAFALYLAKGAVGVGEKRGPHFYVWAVY